MNGIGGSRESGYSPPTAPLSRRRIQPFGVLASFASVGFGGRSDSLPFLSTYAPNAHTRLSTSVNVSQRGRAGEVLLGELAERVADGVLEGGGHNPLEGGL